MLIDVVGAVERGAAVGVASIVGLRAALGSRSRVATPLGGLEALGVDVVQGDLASASSGYARMSPSSMRVKSTLPAPINVIRATLSIHVRERCFLCLNDRMLSRDALSTPATR